MYVKSEYKKIRSLGDNKMEHIKKILSLYKSKPDSDFYTHVSLFNPTGKFSLYRDVIEEFWTTYCDAVSSNRGAFLCGLAEKPTEYVPVLVDLDIAVEETDSLDTSRPLYSETEVKSLIKIYQTVLKNILKNCTDKNLICFVLEKPMYKTVCTDEKRIVKNGFHLHFPYTFLSKTDHETQLYPRVEKLVKETNAFGKWEIPQEYIKLDKASYRACWLLYGSRKNEKSDSYSVTTIYDHDFTKISLEAALSGYEIYNIEEELIDIQGKEKYYLPRILSINSFYRINYICELNPNIEVPDTVKRKVESIGAKPKTFRTLTITENLEKAKAFVNMLSVSRSEDRNDWIMIGWILYNVGDGCAEALNLWQEFSKKCSLKYDASACIYEWEHMVKRNLSIGTLAYYAKLDSPDEYHEYTSSLSHRHITNAIASNGHNDIARAMYEKYSSEFVCASLVNNLWYVYEDHIWKTSEDGVHLRKKISDDIVQIYTDMAQKAFIDLRDSNDKSEQEIINDRITKLRKCINNLKSHPYKSNIMKECKEVFYDENFLKKLDKNPYLIAFQNGVYDLKNNSFRPGIPDDYLSKQMAIDYKDFNEKDKEVGDVMEFLVKVFPDKDLRSYFLDTSSDIFVGGNRRKLVILWSGEGGDNGKSITQLLFERIFGKYSVKLPTSLLTSKRSASNAACPELSRAGNGVRQAVLQEPSKTDIINIGLLKELSGNDTFFARGLYQNGCEIEPMFKLFIICNNPPVIPYDDQATWNRIRVIPFESTFCDDAPETYEEQLLLKRFPKDCDFADKIPSMAQAMAWVLLEHRKKPTLRIEPEKVKLATQIYKKRTDIYKQFMDDHITATTDTKALSLTEIYCVFKEWFRDSNPGHSVPTKSDVKDYFVKQWGTSTRGWTGYKIRTIEDINE